MTTLQKVAECIYSVQTKSPKDMINGFEKYQEIIDNSDIQTSGEAHTLLARLTSDYGIALTTVGNYSRALSYLDKGLSLILSDPRVDKNDLKSLRFYEEILSNRGVCNYHLKAFNKSAADFSELTKLFPENKVYKEW